jgi:hypothetical protein
MDVTSVVLLVVVLSLVVGNNIASHKRYGALVAANEIIPSSAAAPVVPLRLCIDLSLFGDNGQGGKVIIVIL